MLANRYSSVTLALTRHLISPQGLAIMSLAPLLIILPFPATLYEIHVKESFVRSQVFHAAYFYALNVIIFICGATFYAAVSSTDYRRRHALITQRQLAFPLSIAIALQIVSICLTIAVNPSSISNILRGAGQTVKLEHQNTGTLSQASTLLAATIWWYFYHMLQNNTAQRSSARSSRRLLYFGITAFVLNAVIRVARFEIIPFSADMFIIYMLHITKHSPRPLRTAARFLLLFSIFTVFIFVAFSLLRGGDSGDTLESSILGYFFSPFVHLASLLDGTLRLPFPGEGLYVSPFLYSLPGARFYLSPEIVNRAEDLGQNFKAEFMLTAAAGLDGRYVWVTAFGPIYADLGNYIYLYDFLLGALFYYLYKLLIRGSTMGIVLYPYSGMSILLWPTFNILSQPRLNVIFVATVALTFYARSLAGGDKGVIHDDDPEALPP